jgi:hypothetical protein
MSDPTFNAAIYRRQLGSVETVDASGTLQVLSGGSIQVASGGNINVAAATGLTFQAGISNGGTTGRWAFGTVGLTSGVGTIATGLNRVISASIQPISADPPGLGSFTTSVIDLSLAGAGSVIVRAGAGTLPYTNNGTAAWMAWGT